MSAYLASQSSTVPDQLNRLVQRGTAVQSDDVLHSGIAGQIGTHRFEFDYTRPTESLEALEFQVVRDLEAFEALEDEWTQLFARAGKPHQVYQTFNWCWHWCNHFLNAPPRLPAHAGANSQAVSSGLFVLAARRNGKLVMVWPMVLERSLGVFRLSWLGSPVSQYGDVVVDDVADKDALLRAGWDYLLSCSNVDFIKLSKVRDDSEVASLLENSDAVVMSRQSAPYLEIGQGASADEYFKLKSKKAARNRRRARRRLEDIGAVSFEVLPPGQKSHEVALNGLELKRAWLKERGLFSRALSDKRVDRFFGSVAEGGTRCVETRVSKLNVDGQDVAIEIGFPCKGALAVHVIVYDHTFNRFSCGALAMEESISACWNDGFSTYDLQSPGDAYKMQWSDQTIGVNDWSVPASAKGSLRHWLELNLGKNSIKRALALLPDALRQPVARFANGLLGGLGK